jgi:hypothetical protein
MVTVPAMMDWRDDDVRQCSAGPWIGRVRPRTANPAVAPHVARVPGLMCAPSLLLQADEAIE